MKKCKSCGYSAQDTDKFCQMCGGNEFYPLEPTSDAEREAAYSTAETAQQTVVYSDAAAAPVQKAEAGNVVAGIVGALLFALGGAAVYFLFYQINMVSALSGVVMFVLANFGYGLFARSKGSVAGIVVAAVVTLVMLFVAEYLCISYEIWKAYRYDGVDIFAAIRVTSAFLEEPEVRKAFFHDLAYAYLFGIIGLVSSVMSHIKRRKQGA